MSSLSPPICSFWWILVLSSATKEIVRVRHDKAAQEKIMGDVLLARLWLAGGRPGAAVILTAALPILRERPLLSLCPFPGIPDAVSVRLSVFRGLEKMEAIVPAVCGHAGVTALTFVR